MKNLNKDFIIIKAFSRKIIELFNENKKGKDKQYHSDNFKKLLKFVNLKIETKEMKIQKYELIKEQSDFEIRDAIGGQDKLVHKTRESALVTLSQTMVDEQYRDGKANIVYYLNESGVLCFVCCYWDWDVNLMGWVCDADRMNDYSYPVGIRIFYQVA